MSAWLVRRVCAVLQLLLVAGLALDVGCGCGTQKRELDPRRTEELILSQELASEGSGTSYKVDVYHSPLHKRLRIEVYVDGRHLKNLHNRVRVDDPGRPLTLDLTREDAEDVLVVHQGGRTCHIRLQEEPFDVQAIYAALERYTEEHEPGPGWCQAQVLGPAGLLGDTYLGEIVRHDIDLCPPAEFLVKEDGTITPLTSEQLVIAYRKAGIEATTAEDRERIARSILELIEPRGVIISGLDDIAGYHKHPLDADVEATVRAPWSYEGDDATVYWIAYTYARNQGYVTRYKVRFFAGRLIGSPVDKLLLGAMIGDCYLPE